jgi:hypothetical protein
MMASSVILTIDRRTTVANLVGDEKVDNYHSVN